MYRARADGFLFVGSICLCMLNLNDFMGTLWDAVGAALGKR